MRTSARSSRRNQRRAALEGVASGKMPEEKPGPAQPRKLLSNLAAGAVICASVVCHRIFICGTEPLAVQYLLTTEPPDGPPSHDGQAVEQDKEDGKSRVRWH